MGYQANYQFETSVNRPYAVRARFVGGEIQSPGISFDNYDRMHTVTHKLNAGRRGPAPAWAFNDTQLRGIIVRCVQNRAYMAGPAPQEGTDAQRLAAAQKRMVDRSRPHLLARIDRLCKEYMAAKQACDSARVQEIAPKVEECDTQLCMLDRGPEILAGCVYHYYRCGLNSVETGQQLGIKPPHVRALLWRLGKAAGQLGYGPLKAVTVRETTAGELTSPDYLVLAAKLQAKGHTMDEIKTLFRCNSKHALRQSLRNAGLYVRVENKSRLRALQPGQFLPQARAR